jgi:signal transduction histidine kinase
VAALSASLAIELAICATGNGPDRFIGVFVVCAAELLREDRGRRGLDALDVLALSSVVAVALVPYGLHWSSNAVFRGDARTANAGLGLYFVIAAFFLRMDWTRTDRKVKQADADRKAALEEQRSQIARELHDVVAHQMSVVVAQSQGAAAVVETDPGRARLALDLIGGTTRDALSELRRLLGVLRTPDGESVRQPSVADIERLVRDASAADLTVDFKVSGDVGAVPPGLATSVYRIVQEALTNAAKYAAGSRAVVSVTIGSGRVDVQVDNTAGRSTGQPGSGVGLVGMRERVDVFGGTLATGAQPDGGWRVHATFPVSNSGSTPAAPLA